MSQDDVLFGYRLQLVDYAGRTSVSEACRVFGVHRSTYYVWKRRIERQGLEILRVGVGNRELDVRAFERRGLSIERRACASARLGCVGERGAEEAVGPVLGVAAC